VFYLHADRQGSTSLVTGPTGQPYQGDESIFANLFYDPWGRRLDSAYQQVPNNRIGGPRQLYTGHYHDDEIYLINMRGRMYDPHARRFLTPDPIVPNPLSGQDYNRYAYVGNNPTTLTDPTGHIGEGGGSGDRISFGGGADGWNAAMDWIAAGGLDGLSPSPLDAPLITQTQTMASMLSVGNGADGAADDSDDADLEAAGNAADTVIDVANLLDKGGPVVKALGAVLDIIWEGSNATAGVAGSCHEGPGCLWDGAMAGLSGVEAAGGIMTWLYAIRTGSFAAGAAAAAEAFPNLMMMSEVAAGRGKRPLGGPAVRASGATNPVRSGRPGRGMGTGGRGVKAKSELHRASHTRRGQRTSHATRRDRRCHGTGRARRGRMGPPKPNRSPSRFQCSGIYREKGPFNGC